MQFGTNHLGHFLFTNLMVPLLRKSADAGFHPRIIIVTSKGHERAQGMKWDDLMYEASYDPQEVYYQSKLANILHAKELALRLADTGINVYSLHPGVIATDLSRHLTEGSAFLRCMKPVIHFMIKTPEQGAQTTLYCALDDKIERDSGKYYSDCAETEPSEFAQDMDAARRLWDESEKLVNPSEDQIQSPEEADDQQ